MSVFVHDRCTRVRVRGRVCMGVCADLQISDFDVFVFDLYLSPSPLSQIALPLLYNQTTCGL